MLRKKTTKQNNITANTQPKNGRSLSAKKNNQSPAVKSEKKPAKPKKRGLGRIISRRIPKHELAAKTKEIEKGLKSIYQDSQGKMPNMSSLDFKKRSKLKLVIFIIFVLLIIFAISFMGFLVFQPKPKFTGDNINLEIKAPFTAISGETINYEIKFVNQEEISFTNTQLIVYLPQGFIFKKSNLPETIREDQQGFSNIKTWQINDLFPNDTKTLEIEGKLIGPLNTNQTISATLSYTPANFSSEFQKNISFNTEVIDSLVTQKFEYPSQIANQEETEFNLIINNDSEEIDLQNIEVELDFSPEFTLSQSQIVGEKDELSEILIPEKENEEEANQKTWAIAQLLFQTQKQINFKGKFEVAESQNAQFNIKVKLKGPSDEYFVQSEETYDLQIIKGELLTNLIIQGSNQNKPVNFNDTLNYLLSIQNKSKDALGDIKVRTIMDSPFLDWSTLNDDNNGINEDAQILWTKDQIPELEIMLPEEEIEITFQIKLIDYEKSNRYQDSDYQVKSFFETQINTIGSNQAEIVNESNTIINEINTNLGLEVAGRYFDDNNNTIGSGPLPPIVGQKTSYKIFWTLTNELHEIRNIEIKTKLPNYVNFEGQQNISTGDLNLNQNNEIVWQIGRIPTTVTKTTAVFEISITPKSEDVHKILTLFSDTNLKATDVQTQSQINIANQGITTNLDTDPLANGKGLVQEE